MDTLQHFRTKSNFIARGMNRVYHRRLGTRKYNTDGINVFSKDWDNLLLLDACRYDAFVDTVDLPGETIQVESCGSATQEYLRGNCHGRQLHDTVYITGNAQYRQYELELDFYDIVDVWSSDSWDDDLGTIPPGEMADAARQAIEKYPQKRLFIHFLQPHYPFISSPFDSGRIDGSSDSPFFWHELMLGQRSLSPEQVWRAYIKNLEEIIPFIEDLLHDLPGKTVVTSDHGNMFAERSTPVPGVEWGHPPGIYTSELTKVPWHIAPTSDRRKIVPEPPVTTNDTRVDRNVEDHLQQLGYMTGQHCICK